MSSRFEATTIRHGADDATTAMASRTQTLTSPPSMEELKKSNISDVSTVRGQNDQPPASKEEPEIGNEYAAVDPPTESDSDFPEGGFRAWMCVFGVSCGTCATFGFVNAWGVFQAYYQATLLKDSTPSDIAWIGSVQYALVFIPGLVFGRLFDMGIFKGPLIASSALLVAATFLTAQCTQYWQFILCQGIAVGLGCGMIFGPIVGTIPHWFKKKLGVALGLMAVGSSIGGCVFPIAVQNLINLVGFQWTMRIIGFIQLFLMGICILGAERRLPPRKRSGPFFNVRAFKSPAYTWYTISTFVSFLGLYTVLTYIDVSAQFAGVDPNFSFYLLSIANAGSAVGRVGGGILSDVVGALNIMIPATFIAGILTYAWPFATSKGAIIVIAVIYGIASGVYVSLLTAPIVRMGETHDVGNRIGMTLTVLAFGALGGPPISGAINDATGNFKAVGIYAGSTVMGGVVLMLISRYYLLRSWRGKC
ncbi:MFS general substrate transporter [Obba rivulosa]|uniref:MFS general substrate transporter n=1 Tax=Obba rivulosa TaxID=1052685 RepID=A0A8E2AVF5_9APHY|nr:MFS general substrate transporter [Obba rivulosa]